MVPKRRLKRRQEYDRHEEYDRRRTPDRRSGVDRRMGGGLAAVEESLIFNTREACEYLKISRPTFLKYIAAGKIKAQKIGKGWKVFKAELDRFARGL